MKIISCEIYNEIDNKNYTIYVEWFNSHFKVVLLESTVSPLCGEMSIEEINYFSNELSMSTNEYLKETEKIFCQQDKEIKFLIEDKTLEWKKNAWTRGKIKLSSVLDINVICEKFQQLLKLYQNSQSKLNMLEEENKNITCTNKELSSEIERMTEIKISMEQDLYKKFIMTLNAKKKKVMQLEDVIKNKYNVKESIFDVLTDESEESEKEDHAVCNNSTISIRARKVDCIIDNETCNTSNSKKLEKNKIHILDNSTIKGKKSTYEKESYCSKNKKSRTCLNLTEEESEEELFS